jgi:uncharacterized protein (TIGR00730 family)
LSNGFSDRLSIEQDIEALIDRHGGGHDRSYVVSMISTALGLSRDAVPTLDMKIAASALKEMREAFLMLAPYRDQRKVTIFGSARTEKGDPLFDHTVDLARALASREWMVVTGAGPGIMEAGMIGAGRERSIGVSIRLPFETAANEIIAGDTKFVSMRYFFTRKLMLVKESHAFVCMPGGFGTLDEMYELLTLTQTGKGLPVPIVLMDLPGDPFWESVQAFVGSQLLPRRLISPEDTNLFKVCTTIEDAVHEIDHFYSNYHSIRYVGNRLVVRLHRPVTDVLLDRLNTNFASLLREGQFERTEPTGPETSDNDHLNLYRLTFRFKRNDYGRLRSLIDCLNDHG